MGVAVTDDASLYDQGDIMCVSNGHHTGKRMIVGDRLQGGADADNEPDSGPQVQALGGIDVEGPHGHIHSVSNLCAVDDVLNGVGGVRGPRLYSTVNEIMC